VREKPALLLPPALLPLLPLLLLLPRPAAASVRCPLSVFLTDLARAPSRENIHFTGWERSPMCGSVRTAEKSWEIKAEEGTHLCSGSMEQGLVS
jgi:hypothetical protein